MSRYILFCCSILTTSISKADQKTSSTCAELSKQFGVPCLSVPTCSNGAVSTKINQLSNGKAESVGTSIINICYNADGLFIKHEADNHTISALNSYNSCNDDIYNLNVAELFIAPFLREEPVPHCYSEIDISPKDVMFESGIYNSNLNHTGISNYLIDCSVSGVKHEVLI